MRLRDFVRLNRKAIDNYIAGLPGMRGQHPKNDDEREQWVMNDEPLYREFCATNGVTREAWEERHGTV
jgi:hypothetical protein